MKKSSLVTVPECPDLKVVYKPPVAARGVFLPQWSNVRHLIENGALIYTWLDLETTDKDWQMAEITVASLTLTDIGYNLLSDDLFEVCVPDRVGLSPEAMLITRYMAPRIRSGDRLSPQKAAALIYETIQDAPRRLWQQLGDWRERLGDDLWRSYVAEKEVLIPGRTGKEKPVTVRHFPVLDESGSICLKVRVHEPQRQKEFMQMSYLVAAGETADYSDEHGNWRIHQLDKYNLGFRNTFFDNRLMAAALFRANFPHKEIYALNRKGLGNHSADVFTIALSDHFFNPDGQTRIRTGQRTDPETTRVKISAKLDLLMEENSRLADPAITLPEGVRVFDGTLHNLKRGHNAPDYDNAKTIGLHRYIRTHNPKLLGHLERCSRIDYFREFLTLDDEDGTPTTHPLRFAVVSANDDAIYRAIPVMILGSDDQHGKFNKIWAMRADLNAQDLVIEGKKILDMAPDKLAEIMRLQRGRPDALFHEINLRRHRGVVSLEDGLRAGHTPEWNREKFRRTRDEVIDYLDESDRPFLNKALDAFALQYTFAPPADDVPQPYVEEEIWTAMGDIKYLFVKDEHGETRRLPNLIREMAQDEFRRLNDRIGDTLRDLMRPQPLELDPSIENALAYALLREKKIKKLVQYQAGLKEKKQIHLPLPFYDASALTMKNATAPSLTDVYATLIQDKLYLMDLCPESTRSYEVQQRLDYGVKGKSVWQRIPFGILAAMPDHELHALKDEGRVRVRFERNPNHPAERFMIRYFMENGMGDLLGQAHRDFYLTETAIYTHGPEYLANPGRHRIMSAPRIRESIARIRQNIKPGDAFLSATRAGETGAGNLFMADDFSEAILDSVNQDTLRRARRYPQTDNRKFQFSIDPQTSRPLLNVKYEIPSDHIIVTIPDAHSETTAAHSDFGRICLVVPLVAALADARHIVIEEALSGRRYYAADPAVFNLPSRSGAYENFFETIDSAYAHSGLPAPQSGYVLSCAELAPIAKTKDPEFPSLRISQSQLMATRNPQLANFQRSEPLDTFIVRKYDLRLKKNQKIRLRGLSRDQAETGWEGVTRIAGKPEEITLADLLTRFADPACHEQMDRLAFSCGDGTADDLKARLIAEFTRFDEDRFEPDHLLLIFRIHPVKRISYWTAQAPRACFERTVTKSAKPPDPPRSVKLAPKASIIKTEPEPL